MLETLLTEKAIQCIKVCAEHKEIHVMPIVHVCGFEILLMMDVHVTRNKGKEERYSRIGETFLPQ